MLKLRAIARHSELNDQGISRVKAIDHSPFGLLHSRGELGERVEVGVGNRVIIGRVVK